MGHLNELQLVIRMNEYSLRKGVIQIFEYSNHLLETLPETEQVGDVGREEVRAQVGEAGGALHCLLPPVAAVGGDARHFV